MKNLFKLSGCLLLAAIMGLSSCVKNEVAPEVAQIRQAQLAKLNAEVAAILAEVDYQDAQTAYQELVNAFKAAKDASDLTAIEAQNEAAVATAEANLEQQKLVQAQQAAAYQRFIEQGQFSANVVDLLGKFNNENQVLQQLYSDRITIASQIANKELLLNSDDWALWKARWEDQLADLNGKLAAQQAALTAYEAVVTDPASLETAINDLDAQIVALEDEIDSLETAKTEAANDITAAQNLVDDANLPIGLMEDWDALYGSGFIQDELDYLDDSLGIVQDITDATADLSDANAALTLAKSTLTAAKSALTSATSAYNAKQALYNTALTNNTTAENTLATKEVLLEVATNNYNAGVAAIPALSAAALQALQDAMDAAQTARDDAFNAINDPDGTLAKLNQAETDRDTAETTMNNAQTDVDNAQTNVDNAQTNVDNLMDDIASYNQDMADNAIDLAIIRGKIAEWTPRYEAALAALPGLEANVGLLMYKDMTIQLEIWAVEDMISELEDVRDNLANHFSDIQNTIISQKLAIGDTEDQIVAIQAQIDGDVIDMTFLEGEIANLEALLAVTEAKITESEAIVAVWKKLLDDAIAAQG